MENRGYLEVIVSGRKGSLELTSENLDIKEIALFFEQVEKLLFPDERRERPVISYQLESGSVVNRFYTSYQVIIGFNANLSQIKKSGNIDFLEPNTASAIETLQDIALKKNYGFLLRTSVEDSVELKIDKTTFYFRTTNNLVDAEFYLYGKITGAGGKDKATIHLLTEEYGTLIIQVSKDLLAEMKENILYKNFIIRAAGKQNLKTGELDKQNLTLLELIDYSNEYNEKYLARLRDRAMKWLKDIDTDEYLREIRGYDE